MKYTILTCFSIVFFLFSSVPSIHASHVFGGEITYECLAANLYEVEMKLYRDCTGAQLANTLDIKVKSLNCDYIVTITLDTNAIKDITPICPGVGTGCDSLTVGFYGVEEYVYTGTIDFNQSPFTFYSNGNW